MSGPITLATLDARVTTLEKSVSDISGRFYKIDKNIDATNLTLYVRDFNQLVNYFGLEANQTYTCHLILTNTGGSGQITSDVTVEIKYSPDSNQFNLVTDKVLQSTRKDIAINGDQTTIVNITPFTIPAAATYIELYISVAVKTVNTAGVTAVSLHLYKPYTPTQVLVNQ